MFLCSEEEVSFGRTLDKGIARLKKAAAAAKSANQKHIDSRDAFEMWDTYGFPVDLTQVSFLRQLPNLTTPLLGGTGQLWPLYLTQVRSGREMSR